MADNDYLTPKDIENILHLSHPTVSRLINLPDFPAIRIGRSVRVRRDKLDEYMVNYVGKVGVVAN